MAEDTGSQLMEDPSSALSRFVAELKALGYDSYSSAWDAAAPGPANPLKLRAGYGDAVARALLFLTEKAMEARGWRWQRAALGAGEVDEEGGEVEEDETAGADDEDEITEKDVPASFGDDEGDVVSPAAISSGKGLAGSRSGSASRKDGKNADIPTVTLGVLEPTVDATAWRKEVERVAPRLKAAPSSLVTTTGISATAAAGKEWRSHLEQTEGAEGSIGKLLPDMKASLEREANELAELLATVSNRERYINTSMKGLASDYSSINETFLDLKSSYQASSDRVSALSNELASLNEALEDLQQNMNEKGSSMTDTSPLIRIKTALTALRNEMKLMDLHLGVVGHAVMQSKIDHKIHSGHAAEREDSEED